MSLSLKLFTEFVSGVKNPEHYFRTRKSPPLVLVNPVYLPNGHQPITNLEIQVYRTDVRHQQLRLISSILTDLAPGQYCTAVHRLVSNFHEEALTAIKRAIFICNTRKLFGLALFKNYEKLVTLLAKIDNALRRALAPGIANCQCEPDLSKLYDDKGQEITEELDSVWYSMFGVHLSNAPHCDQVPFIPKPNVKLELSPPGEDMVDSPFGFGESRLPKWLKKHFLTSGIFSEDSDREEEGMEVEFQSGEPEEDFNPRLENPTLSEERIPFAHTKYSQEEDFAVNWDSIDKILDNLDPKQKAFLESLLDDVSESEDELDPEEVLEDAKSYLDSFEDVQLQTGFEKRPENSTKVDSKSRSGVVFDDLDVSLFHTTRPVDHKCEYMPACEPCDFEPQVVGTLDIDTDPTAYKFRLGAKSHSKLDLMSKAYAYMTCDWVVKLAIRTPLGVTGKFKVVSLDAKTAGAFGDPLGRTTVAQVMSREGDFWDIAAQPEFVFHVPYNTNLPVVRPSEVTCGVALANYAKLSIPTGVAMPRRCYISVMPVNVRFYAKKRIEIQPIAVPIPLTEDAADLKLVDVPPTGGIVRINYGKSSGIVKLAVFRNLPNTEIGTLLESQGTGAATTSSVEVAYAPGRQLYIQQEGTIGTIETSTLDVTITPLVETVIIQSETVDVEHQGEMLGTEETSVNTSDYKENYGSLGNRVQAPTGQALVNVAAERKIFVPVKTVAVTDSGITGTPLFSFKVHPRNFGLTGNTGTYTTSHASLEAERFVYFGPSSSTNNSSFCTAKFTSVANAYSNARLLIAAIPPGLAPPSTVLGASQFPRCYHVLHGGETEFEIPWQSQLPIEYTNGDTAPATIQVWLLENTTVAGQGSPQLTMWISADGLKYSVPRSPQTFTVLP